MQFFASFYLKIFFIAVVIVTVFSDTGIPATRDTRRLDNLEKEKNILELARKFSSGKYILDR